MSSTIPSLGSTWEKAVKDCYHIGYDYFSGIGFKNLKEELRQLAHEHGDRYAVDVAMNDAGIDAAIHENEGYRRLWWAIEDFYEEHMSQEEYERFQREAAVAEDLDAAWEAGAFDALLGRDKTVEQVSHFYDS